MQMVLSRRGRWEDTEARVSVASTAAVMMALRAVTNGAVSLFHSPPAASTHVAASVSPRALLPFWDMYQEEVNERLQSRKSMFAAVYIACTAHSILGV
jgi:hypothetical protein